MLLWQSFQNEEKATIDAAFNEQSSLLNFKIAQHMDETVIAIQRMADRWDMNGGTEFKQWQSDAQNYVNDFPAQISMGWAAADLYIKWITPIEGNEEAQGLYIAFEDNRRNALEKAKELRKATISPPVDLVQGGRGFILYTPLYVDETFDGFFTAVYDPQRFFSERMNPQLFEMFEFSVTDGNRAIFKSPGIDTIQSDWVDKHNYTILEREWTITLVAKPAFIKLHNSYYAELSLVAGIILSFLSGLLIYNFYLSLKRNALLEAQTEVLRKKEIEQEKLVGSLADSNEELARFAYVCSHDLQEPLRMVRLFSQKLETHLNDKIEDDPKGQRYFNFITDGAERSQKLIQDILTYSKIGSDEKPNDSVDLNEIVNTVRDNLAALLDDKNGTVTTDILPVVQGNKTQILQILQNLTNNGMKYQDGSTAPHVHISATETDGFWEVSVKDNGIGIAKEYQSKIFDVFQRLHRRQEYAGTGIGLSICKKIAKRHGGDIRVTSDIGDGATFSFTLAKPLKSRKAA